MAKSLAEAQKDLVEVNRLLTLSTRDFSKDLLQKEKSKLEKVVADLKAAQTKEAKPKSRPTLTTTIKSYSWDQSDKFIKIYLTNLKGVKELPAENIKINGTQVTIENLNNKNFIYNLPKLLHETSTFTFKQKDDMLLLMLKKTEANKKWEFLTKTDKEKKDEKDSSMDKPGKDEAADPSASIMNMMKKMYNEGDDEMKKTIAKAWTQARDKNPMGGGMPGMGGMPAM